YAFRLQPVEQLLNRLLRDCRALDQRRLAHTATRDVSEQAGTRLGEPVMAGSAHLCGELALPGAARLPQPPTHVVRQRVDFFVKSLDQIQLALIHSQAP